MCRTRSWVQILSSHNVSVIMTDVVRANPLVLSQFFPLSLILILSVSSTDPDKILHINI